MPENQYIHDMLSLSEQKEFLLNGLPVSVLTGNEFTKKGIIILPLGRHKDEDKRLSAMIAAPIAIASEEFVCIVVIRQYASGNKKLYVHEVSLKQKLLDDSSNPALIPAAYQGVESCLATDCAKTVNQGNVAKIIQKIISTK